MISPDDLNMMNEQEKLDLLRQLSDTTEWQETFEPIYRRLLKDDSAEVRQEAVAALWDLADPRHIEVLMKMAESDPDVRVRGKAASVLGIFVYNALVDGAWDQSEHIALRSFLLDLAQDSREDPFVRRMSIEALSFDPDEAVDDLIEWAYHQESTEMKMTAIFAMGRSGRARWTEIILAELSSEDPKILMEAVNASAEAGIRAATPRLRNLVRHTDRDIRIAAIWALTQTKGPGAMETLEMCANSSDEEVRTNANEAIEEMLAVPDFGDEDGDNKDTDEPDNER